jgi:putative pyruvate formate lyase activating enzyme
MVPGQFSSAGAICVVCFAKISRPASLAKAPKSYALNLRTSWWISSRPAATTVSFVTPEHVVPQILEALPIAIDRGLRLPLVYNTSAYDSLESIQLMEEIVDVYMPDFKLWHTENCRNYLVAIDYAGAARTAIAAMHAQVGAKGG